MADNGIELPKNAVAAATLVIFIHWAGASFAGTTSATTWLGAVEITRGWMIGVFIHAWFIISFVLLWQKQEAKSLRQLSYEHKEFLIYYLFRLSPTFFDFLQRACRDAEHDKNSKNVVSLDTLLSALRDDKGVKITIDGSSIVTMLPVIEHKWTTFQHYVDFSRVGLKLGSSSGGPITGTSAINDLPCYAIPRKHFLTFIRFELIAFWNTILRNPGWHQQFLPWILAWLAVVSIAENAVGLL